MLRDSDYLRLILYISFFFFLFFIYLSIYLLRRSLACITGARRMRVPVHSAVTAGARAIWLGDFIYLFIYLFIYSECECPRLPRSDFRCVIRAAIRG